MRGIDLVRGGLPATYRQVYHWTSQGYIFPFGGTLPQGSAALEFSDKETRVLRIMAHLVAFGLRPAVAAGLARDHMTSGNSVTIIDIDGVGHLHIVG